MNPKDVALNVNANPRIPNHESEPYPIKNRVRFVTAASLFDGHDASINIMRRILQSSGAEVIHLGHNRSVWEIVSTAIQEDAQGIAISSYQGGHVEYFKYMIDLLKENHCPHIKVFGGGGGTITPAEIKELEAYGVCRLYSPDEGLRLGLQGLINDMLKKADVPSLQNADWQQIGQFDSSPKALAEALTCVELGEHPSQNRHLQELKKQIALKPKKGVVVGLTGTGGAGKSSLTDELILRILENEKESRIAVLAIDPTRKKTGGALLGDRLRMNTLKSTRCFMRSFATREANVSISRSTQEAVELLRASNFDWIFVETGGIGQADTSIVEISDINLYVMTSEFGAPTQLEKINMLDYAHLVVINKFDKAGSLDALNDVKRQLRRNHRELESVSPDRYPVFGTMASHFGDPGVSHVYEHLTSLRKETQYLKPLLRPFVISDLSQYTIVPKEHSAYLADISSQVRHYHALVRTNVELVHQIDSYETVLQNKTLSLEIKKDLAQEHTSLSSQLNPELKARLEEYLALAPQYQQDTFTYQVRGRNVSVPVTVQSLSHNKIRKISLPKLISKADLANFVWKENLPGFYPFTAGVFPFKRTEEDPKRMFAGEGTPTRTNKRFHLLCASEKAKRLSTAFDSVTLYGNDPDERPDIYGKIGESGVSVCSLEDAKKLYAGFNLCDPNTSVSMTINGPAPMLLAFYFNTAIDQQIERFEKQKGSKVTEAEYDKIKRETLSTVRGTVQADILKEDQAQNTCIFSTEFALRMMGDIQKYFIDNQVKNYYSVSISGYHIAEAGANPISQVAFTLANGFTFVEYYRSRKMNIDDFAPNFSFFFSNGLDAEYTVIGRVARRIWAIAMKNRYRASERSQKLKYHIQTSGRSLHAQEISFNDIRTTLQALIAYYDHCNSLHTNAYDEAVTTPTEESVRRAMAIQMIITKELGWAKNENPLQGSYFIDELTDLVEEAVLAEFDRISARGGVLGAMETHYQRTKIQEESLYYERLKHSGGLPIVGVNTFLNPHDNTEHSSLREITRASTEEKKEQITNLRQFQKAHETEAKTALEALKQAAIQGDNLFEALMKAARVCSLGQMTSALYQVGGEYRRAV